MRAEKVVNKDRTLFACAMVCSSAIRRRKALILPPWLISSRDFRYGNPSKLGVSDKERADKALKGIVGKRHYRLCRRSSLACFTATSGLERACIIDGAVSSRLLDRAAL